jgi:hypothetical protein
MLSNFPQKSTEVGRGRFLQLSKLKQAGPKSGGIVLHSSAGQIHPADHFLLDFPCQGFIKKKFTNYISSTLKK